VVKTQAKSTTKPPRGRRPAGAQTRAAIAEAARRQFSELGYRDTTLRSVAGEAGVDHRLVLHYFGSKQRLFIESIEFPVDPEALLARIFKQGDGDVAGLAAEAFVSVLEEPTTRQMAIALIRAAASEPEAAELIRQILTERLLLPLAQRVGGKQSRLRASFCASQFVGLAMARYVVGVEPLASMPGEQVVKALTPVFEHYLYGDWVDPDPADDQTASGSPS
jgi:AcrR family transcriptional regulator